jgi:hypothetical protein
MARQDAQGPSSICVIPITKQHMVAVESHFEKEEDGVPGVISVRIDAVYRHDNKISPYVLYYVCSLFSLRSIITFRIL